MSLLSGSDEKGLLHVDQCLAVAVAMADVFDFVFEAGTFLGLFFDGGAFLFLWYTLGSTGCEPQYSHWKYAGNMVNIHRLYLLYF